MRRCSFRICWRILRISGRLLNDGNGLFELDPLGCIRMYPLAWHPLGRTLRRCHLKRFRYGVIYRIRGEQAGVIVIAHDSRRLGYWRDTLGAN